MITGKYIEAAQPNFNPKKATTCISEKKSILAAQAFGFREDKCVTKKVRVVSLACDMPTGLYICLYQILSKYFKPLRSYVVHKNLA